jgi:hypothetical protein
VSFWMLWIEKTLLLAREKNCCAVELNCFGCLHIFIYLLAGKMATRVFSKDLVHLKGEILIGSMKFTSTKA